jgi:hypothetical protein
MIWIGFLLLFVGYVLVLIKCFSEDILWGLVCLFLPIAVVVFICFHWRETKLPACLIAIGFLLVTFEATAATEGILQKTEERRLTRPSS